MEHTYEVSKLESELRRALNCREFRLHFQPKIDLKTGKIKGAEALIRWEHPEKGLIFPGEFISIAEETGLIIPMGEWILRTACLQTKKWQESGLFPMEISVNVSVRQLYQPNFVDGVWQILKETELAPQYLDIEITESMMVDSNHAIEIIKNLKSLGVQISLDDFGTGYSSLHYLNELPIDKIKIDQSFIQNCTSNSDNATIVRMIIAMARQLKLEVIAEGIETREQLLFLQQNLCNQGQGYLFGMPLTPEEFELHFYEVEQIVHQEGMAQEIYDQKLMKKALENARQELYETVQQQQGLILKYVKRNEKFIHTLCDGQLMYQMGLTPKQVIGKCLSDLLPIDVAVRKAQFYQRAWEGEENVTYEGKINGITYIALLRPILRAGTVVEVIGSCIDITKQKMAEEALRASEAKYRLIAENVLDLIVTLDKHGVVLYASPSHEKVLGFTTEQYEGHRIAEWIHPDDLPTIRKLFITMLETKKPFQIEFRYKHADSGWVLVESQLTPAFAENGEIEQLVAVGRDISERKMREELLRRSEKLSVIGQLGSSIAHEIRNPLTSIKGFLQLLQKEVKKPLYFNTMLAEVHKIEDIIREFLAFAEPHIHQIKETNVEILLQQVHNLFNTQTIMEDFEVIQECSSDLPTIQCDENQIKQVFIQILQNALEAMPNGGMIRVRMKRQDSDYIKISFIDQSRGISKERISHIGEPFYSTKEKGTGLGLTASNKIVQEHGGVICINSVINKGTAVDVILPIKQ